MLHLGKDISNDMIIIIIQNTYTNKDVNTEEIYQKGVSSKENHGGLGLWKIRQILMHNNNLNLFTTKMMNISHNNLKFINSIQK